MVSLDDVINTARAVVSEPETKLGYSDVGDVIVRRLRNGITDAEAVEKIEALHEDYVTERNRAALREAMDRLSPKTIALVGAQANWARVQDVFGLRGSPVGWMRCIRLVMRREDLVQLQGFRGPDVWWINWGATMDQKIFCRTREFKLATVEEARDVIERFKAGGLS